jgi:RNA polymerase sigma factor (sigma-70 family)
MSDETQVLGAAEEIRLARQIEAGLLAAERMAAGDTSTASAGELAALRQLGTEAWQRFLLANLRLVQSIAGQQARRSAVSPDELFQEGFLGLTDALQRWDHAAGYRFSTYATQWIRRRVENASVGQWLPVSVRSALRARGVRSLADQLTVELRHSVTDHELAALLGRSERWVARMRGLPTVARLDQGLALADATPPEPGHEDDVRALLPALPAAEAEVVHIRFGLDGGPALRQGPAAQALGISVSTLRRHEARALRRLRGWLLAERAA